MIQRTINNEQQMEKFGGDVYRAQPQGGCIIYLSGDLGAGKTTFVRGFLRAMNYHGIVKSPTYTLVEPYELGTHKLFHFDFYRLHSPQELEYMGIRDYFQNEVYCLIEWPEKAAGMLALSDIDIQIEIQDSTRTLSLTANTDRGKDVLQAISQNDA